jgi:tetratricopeptide (TPR) repeat protein
MKKIVLIVLILFSIQLNAQENRQFRIDSLMTAVHSNGLFNGVVLVSDNGKIILQKAYGFSDKNTQTPLSINDRFYIGSLTKQFTAVLILQLQEEGLIDINNPISDYLQELKDSTYSKITIHQLLTHTSGLGSYTSNPNFDKSIDYSEREMFALIKQPLLFKPSTNWSYSNSGYYLLGKIAERVSGKSYGSLLQEKIFEPLEMQNTSFTYDWLEERVAKGYVRTISGITTMPNYSLTSLFSTGGLYSTAGDIFIWAQALNGNKLLTDKSMKILFEPVKNDYACGLYVKKGINEDGNKFERHFHGGIIQGYHSFMLKRIPQKQVVILLDNYYNQEIQTIKNRIWSALVDENIRDIKPMLSHLLYNACSENTLVEVLDSISNNLKLFKNKFTFEEFDINKVGYRLMEVKRYREATAIFNFNITLYSESWNVYDSMGELQLKQRNYNEAEILYKKSLTLNSDNTSAKKALENIKLHTTFKH